MASERCKPAHGNSRTRTERIPIALMADTNMWADESGYQRPVELATVRLRNMVEVLSNWDGYVTNPTTIAQRGATFIFDATGTVLYQYKHRGVLTYSETMPRPLCAALASNLRVSSKGWIPSPLPRAGDGEPRIQSYQSVRT